MEKQWFKLLVGCCLINVVSGCSQPGGWQSQTMSERLQSSSLVVAAEVTGIDVLSPGGPSPDQYNISLQVKCIMKISGSTAVNLDIFVMEPKPTPACYQNGDFLAVGHQIFAQLSHTFQNRFSFDNRNTEAAIYNITTSTQQEVLGLSGFQNPVAPPGGTCPFIITTSPANNNGNTQVSPDTSTQGHQNEAGRLTTGVVLPTCLAVIVWRLLRP